MDYGWMSQALVWFVGGLTAVTATLTAGAFYFLGRSSQYND